MLKTNESLTNRKWIAAGLAAGLCVFGAACNGGGSSGPQTNSNADAEIQLIETQTGHTYTLIENPTLTSGYAVYVDNQTGEYLAVDYAGYSPGMTFSQLQSLNYNSGVVRNLTYLPGSPDTDDCGSDGDEFCGNGTVDAYYGDGYAFSLGTPYLKDLETAGANMEQAQLNQMGDYLQTSYGLSEDRSQDVARLVNNWSSLAKSRSMTDADLADFSKQALGTDLLSFKNAYSKSKNSGDSADFDKMVEKAATTNAVGVEQARKIVTTLLNQ